MSLFLCVLWEALALSAADLAVISGGKSEFSIYHSPDAPRTVKAAAKDLQSYLEMATGAKLPIVNSPKKPMISLGDNASVRAAGLDVSKVPEAGFRIFAKDGSIYVAGQDTPDGKRTSRDGFLQGTSNGVYGFLERFAGVRFLMPTPYGDYVPKHAALTVPADLDWQDVPFFQNRKLPYIQEELPVVRKWMDRQKLGCGFLAYCHHNWMRVVPPEYFETHPEWFCLINGNRSRPTNNQYLLCLTAPGLVEHFAAAADRYFKENPDRYCFSVGPSDGEGWCHCKECSKYYEKDSRGKLSTTYAVVRFYNAVAREVKKKHPDKILGGYIYSTYIEPPAKPIEFADNLVLTYAFSPNYGYTLYRDGSKAYFQRVSEGWGDRLRSMEYYDLPNTCWPNITGAPPAPGFDILRQVYGITTRYNMPGIYLYGSHAWGHSAANNYMLAKLAWNPKQDPKAVFDEFCRYAYGEGAPEIIAMYDLIEKSTREYFRGLKAVDGMAAWVMTPQWMKAVYFDNFPEIERLVLEAKAKITDPDAKQRLHALELNLGILLESFGTHGFKVPASKLALSEEEYSKCVFDRSFRPICFQGHREAGELIFKSTYKGGKVSGRAVDVRPSNYKKQVPVMRNQKEFLVRAKADGPVTMTIRTSRHLGGDNMSLRVFKGKEFVKGGFGIRGVTWNAKAGETFCVSLPKCSSMFRAEVKNADWAVVTGGIGGTQFNGKGGYAWIPVPKGAKEFALMLGEGDPGESVQGTLYSPSGKKFRLSCAKQTADRQVIPVGSGEDGEFWKLKLEPVPGVELDDYNVKVDGIPNLLCLDPVNALMPEPVR